MKLCCACPALGRLPSQMAAVDAALPRPSTTVSSSSGTSPSRQIIEEGIGITAGCANAAEAETHSNRKLNSRRAICTSGTRNESASILPLLGVRLHCWQAQSTAVANALNACHLARVSRRNSTIDDVAKEAGVARVTVSRVLNNVQNVRPETRERVRRAVRRSVIRSITRRARWPAVRARRSC